MLIIPFIGTKVVVDSVPPGLLAAVVQLLFILLFGLVAAYLAVLEYRAILRKEGGSWLLLVLLAIVALFNLLFIVALAVQAVTGCVAG